MFAMAIKRQPSIIFKDQIVSLLSSRSAGKHRCATFADMCSFQMRCLQVQHMFATAIVHI
jgi:SpoVK/Ycf46/Vps4 family AAA+-type ATPase